jgi:group I intron endonuclease
MKTYGVYRIYNTVDGKSYVGQTGNLQMRIGSHFGSLKSGWHSNQRLVAAYKQYGGDVWHSEILEEGLLEEQVDAREVYWIAHFTRGAGVYNNGNGGGYRLVARSVEYQRLTAEMNDLKKTIREKRDELNRLIKQQSKLKSERNKHK